MTPFNGDLLRVACLASLLVPGLAAAGQPRLEPLAFLAGQCWSANMPDGQSIDTHCFEWINAGHQLRDRHVVRGPGEEYRGETIYAWQPERGRIEYRYWDSSGGQSDGHVAAGPDGTLRFLGDRYVASDGSVQALESDLSRVDGDGFRMVTSRLRNSGPRLSQSRSPALRSRWPRFPT